MRSSSFSKKLQTPKRMNIGSSKPHQVHKFSSFKPASSHRRLMFDDAVATDPFQSISPKDFSIDDLIQKPFNFDNIPYDDDFSKQSDQETEESNSCLRSLPSEGRSCNNKDTMEVESFGQGFTLNAVPQIDKFCLSRSPSPKRKYSKISPHAKMSEQEVLMTPVKRRYFTEEKDRRQCLDFFDVRTKKCPEVVSRLNTDYEKVEVIGKGSFGKVYKCCHRLDKNEYAVKETLRKFVGRHRAYGLNEIQALASLTAIEENTNVVRYYNSWIEDDKLYLVMEYCPNSLQAEYLEKGRYSEAELKKILRDICVGLNYLHRNDIVHLDVKPENILISKTKKYKLGDMGQSAIAKLSSEDIEEGDARYLAPEILNPNEFPEQHDLKKADVFSLGVTLFELATGHRVPPNGSEWHAIRNGQLDRLDQVTYLSSFFKNLIKFMLRRDPTQRPSIQDLLTHYVPDELELKLRWEKAERNILMNEKKALEQKIAVLTRRRKSL